MKYLILLVLGILSCNEVAFGCPNFDGRYTFIEEPWNGTITVEQKDCQKITITRSRDYKGRHTDEVKTISADAILHGDTMAFWLNNQLVVQQYVGSNEACGGQYMFNESKCHVVETSISKVSDKNEMFVYSQTGIWWKENGKYQKDHYALIRETNNLKFVPRYAQN